MTPEPPPDPAPAPLDATAPWSLSPPAGAQLVTTPRGAALRGRNDPRARLGAWGEDVAVDHLRCLGWHVMARNWACEIGEIDIVALEPGPTPATETLVLVEVKCRSGTGFGDPLESITVAKVRKLRSLALAWLSASPRWIPRIRLDAIGVQRIGGRPPVITHVRGIS